MGPKCYSLLVSPDELQLKHEQEKAAAVGNAHKPDYVLRTDKLGEVKKCKGVNSSAVNTLQFESFYQVLKHETPIYRTFNKLASKGHVIHQTQNTKKCLSSNDDKRFILSCNVHTTPYGYYKNNSEKCQCDGLG